MRSQAFEVDRFAVTVAVDAGPRILGVRRNGGPDLFADLPDAVLTSAAGTLALLGGHRLWRAPEVPDVTYAPDDQPVTVEAIDGGFSVTGAVDTDGVIKSIEVTGSADVLVVDHRLSNRAAATVRCAPWAITQLRTGGIAYLPLPTTPVDAHGVLPNRSIVLWPYTDPAAAELDIGLEYIRIDAAASQTKTKVGAPNRRGWLAYALDDELFVKWAPVHDRSAVYADLDASAQCYRDQRFIELETLGPLIDLGPDESVAHREVWALIDLADGGIDEALASLSEEPEL